MDPNRITYFAETDARNKKVRFGIKAKDRLKHVYVIGKTGMGKSTLLENMAIQDIQNGEGMAFIDPHGGTAEKLLDYVPEYRVKDVLYFAPFDMEYPVSFNVMEDIGADKRHLVVNGLMSTFEKIWVDAWSARMAYILNNCLLALLEYPGATLLGVNRMLSDKDYRRKVVENVKDASVKAFWVDEFGKWTEKFIAEAIPAIQNKVGQFTSNPLVRNLLGQPESTFDIRTFMDEKKILIINLSKGRVGEGNANLLGSMLITKIYLAAMSRADRSEQELSKLPNFYLYVDEFQSFANKSFADILSEARKYKLNLTIAHQYIEQMEEEVRDAVFGNVGTMVTFRVGALDAEVLEKEFAPVFTAEDLVNLGFAQVYLKLMIDGVSSQPFSATTMGPIGRPEITFKDAVIASSRSQFARPRAAVEDTIMKWHDAGTVREIKPIPPQQNSNGGQNSNSGNSGGNRNDLHGEDRGSHGDRRDSRDGGQNSGFSRPQAQSAPRSEQSYREPQRAPERAPEAQNRTPEPPKMDENKMAFMKVAEELRSKESIITPSSVSQNRTESAPLSLSSLKQNQEAKKVPTKENISSLKDALSQVIKRSDTPDKENSNSTKQTSVQQPAPRPRHEPKKEENSALENSHKKAEEEKPKEKKEEKKEHTTNSMREIPEDLLKKILSMDDSQ